MNSKQAPKLSEGVSFLVEDLIRLANKEGYLIIGGIMRANPPFLGLMRNTTDDPVTLLRKIADVYEEKMKDGRVIETTITPSN